MSSYFIIRGDERFQVLKGNWSAGPSKEGYDFYYSADGVNFTKWPDSVPAGENLVVNLASEGMYYYFSGNKTNIKIQF